MNFFIFFPIFPREKKGISIASNGKKLAKKGNFRKVKEKFRISRSPSLQAGEKTTVVKFVRDVVSALTTDSIDLSSRGR